MRQPEDARASLRPRSDRNMVSGRANVRMAGEPERWAASLPRCFARDQESQHERIADTGWRMTHPRALA